MPTNEQITFTKPGTHLFSPISGVQLRTSDPANPIEGGMLYFMLSTGGLTQLKILFPVGEAQVIAQSTG